MYSLIPLVSSRSYESFVEYETLIYLFDPLSAQYRNIPAIQVGLSICKFLPVGLDKFYI